MASAQNSTMDIVGDIVSPVIDENDIEALRDLKLLPDTRVWLWALHDPSRLSHRVRDVLRTLPTSCGFLGFQPGKHYC